MEVCVRWMRHLLPFQRSVSVPELDWPAATHAEGEPHDTAHSATPGTLGIGWFRHLVPSQCCATADVIPRVGPAVPTARQLEVDGQATLFS
jgi:hypothetical protein